MSKYICVFCDERKESDTAHLINGKIGICRHCFENLDKTAYASPYQGTEHIAFTMSPFEYTKSMRKVILDLKFSNCKAYAKLLADMMKDYLDSYDIWDTFDYIVPVPQSCARELANNGAEQICALTLAIHVQIKLPIIAY